MMSCVMPIYQYVWSCDVVKFAWCHMWHHAKLHDITWPKKLVNQYHTWHHIICDITYDITCNCLCTPETIWNIICDITYVVWCNTMISYYDIIYVSMLSYYDIIEQLYLLVKPLYLLVITTLGAAAAAEQPERGRVISCMWYHTVISHIKLMMSYYDIIVSWWYHTYAIPQAMPLALSQAMPQAHLWHFMTSYYDIIFDITL